MLSNFLDESFSDIININYTSELEKDLDKIATNNLKEIDFLTDFYRKLDNTIEKIEPKKRELIIIEDKFCPKCGSNLVVRTGKYGDFLACPKFPRCKYIEKIVQIDIY